MLRNNIYYRLKPFIPRSIRIAVRRSFAVRTRRRCLDQWPIMPGSERPPADWPGWPEGRKFAFVLTHDVETQAGVDRVRQLAELEMDLGFRSSFYFVPEGRYVVPAGLRNWLVERGFEVGVHDLNHDGRLFSSEIGFQRKAHSINQYVKEWGASGFRSGFMLHRLEWMHHLDVAYDASTFDTDPFEPQPDGVGTIFPFCVDGTECGRGYVEIPYTLPQDSTLFLLLREADASIWKQKLNWIVEHRGMALLNVHPDYVAFPNDSNRSLTYSSALYADFLHWVKETHADDYWHALPADVAKFVRSIQVHQSPVATDSASPMELPPPSAKHRAQPGRFSQPLLIHV